MQLISLSSNRSTFHTVHFKKGLNLILGVRSNPNSKDLNDTFNGVGKSLLIQLIHFCLGCEPIKEFGLKLADWEFTLEFEHNSKKYTAKRSTSDQRKIILDEAELTLEEFRKLFGEELFHLGEGIKFLSFRSLISRFIRATKGSYLSFDRFVIQEKDFQKLINNAYLLGLDPELILKKYDLKIEVDRVDDLRKSLSTDEIFNRYFTQSEDVDIEIIDLQEKVQKLKLDLAGFKVADNYYQVQREADELKTELQNVKNRIILLLNAIIQIDKTLDVRTDVSKDKVIALYEEAKVAIPDLIIKRLDEVSDFHHKLIQSREDRLSAQRENLETEKKELETKRNSLSNKLDDILQFLGGHGALDELVGLSNQLSQFSAKLDKLNAYKGLLQKYKNTVEELKNELSSENLVTNKYIEKIKPVLDRNIGIYRSLSREFYKDRPGGITILNNEGVNQQRFNINVKLEDDASDGINEVKIFCFDLTLLLAKHNHEMEFIFHDSRLFANMDPRQFATLLRLAHQYTKDESIQYIASVNENMTQPILDIYSEDELMEIIDNNIILKLTDESAESKLLGIQVDMEYESE